MHELKGRCDGLAQGRPCARPGPHTPATVCSTLSRSLTSFWHRRGQFSSGSRHSGEGWAATLLSILCPLLGPMFLQEDQDEGKKPLEVQQLAHDPQLPFLHPNLGSRASLKPSRELDADYSSVRGFPGKDYGRQALEQGEGLVGFQRPRAPATGHLQPLGSSAKLLVCSITSPSNCHGALASRRPRSQGSHPQLWPLGAKPHTTNSPLTLRSSVFLRETNS